VEGTKQMKKHVSYTEARNDLSNILNQVCLTHEPVIIERREGKNTIIVSEDDWNTIQETLYLMASSKDWKDITKKVDSSECSETLPW
jgi:antitoxin YefM